MCRVLLAAKYVTGEAVPFPRIACIQFYKSNVRVGARPLAACGALIKEIRGLLHGTLILIVAIPEVNDLFLRRLISWISIKVNEIAVIWIIEVKALMYILDDTAKTNETSVLQCGIQSADSFNGHIPVIKIEYIRGLYGILARFGDRFRTAVTASDVYDRIVIDLQSPLPELNPLVMGYVRLAVEVRRTDCENDV